MQDSRLALEILLAERTKKGDHDAFLELARGYEKTIRKVSDTPNVSNDEKNDLYQEGLIGLYKAALTYDEKSGTSFSTYAGICIKHSIISALRIYYGKKNYPIRSSLPLDSDSDTAEIQGLGLITQPEMLIIERESYEALVSKIDSELSRYERKVLKLFLQGMTYGEISERLQTSTKSVDNAIQRIRGKLKLLIG